MANAQERSLLRQLIDGYIDKNEYDRKLSS